MNKFTKIPTAHLGWDGVEWYNDGFQRIADFGADLVVVDEDRIFIDNYVLDYDQAYELYQDLVSAQLAVVIQKLSRKHLITVQTVVQMLLPTPDGEGKQVPERLIEEITAWLRFALGIAAYTEHPTIWEY